MLSFKLCSIISTCLLIQEQCASFSNHVGNEGSFIDIAKATLQALEKTVDGLTSFCLNLINGSERLLKSLLPLVVKLGQQEVNEVSNRIFKKIDDLKKEANAIRVDVIDCTEDREEDFKKIMVDFLNKTGDCAVNRINELLNSVGIVIQDIKDINEAGKDITTHLENCETDANPTKCVLKVLEEIEQAITKIQAQINQDVGEARKKIDEIGNYLFECEHGTINELQIKSQEIFNGIVECVEKKIQNPNIVYVN